MIFLFISLYLVSQDSSLLSDEGTHLLLSVFYKDLITNIIQTGDLSFESMYQYGINYLVYYPKLQIAYPPLYHLTTALGFSIFGLSESIGRLVNILYAIGTFTLFYIIIRKYFNSKIAFVSSLLFSLSPFALFYSTRALQDFTVLFFLLLSVYIFSKALEKRQLRFFVLAGFTAFLAAMGKQMGGIIIFFYLFYLIWKKYPWKNIIVVFLAFLIPLIPYLLILNSVGGFDINKMVAIEAAAIQGEPTSIFNPYYWTQYLITPVYFAPFIPILLLFFFFYIYQKKPYWKEILLWFLLFYFLLSLIPNKEPRFSQFFMLPVYLTAGYYLVKLKIKQIKPKIMLSVFLLGYLIISLLIFIPTMQYYPSKEISEQVFEKTKGNVALFSEADPFFSSVLMWHIRTLDKDKNIQIFRACIFNNKNQEEILEIIKKNNIYYIVYQTWNPRDIEQIKPYLNLEDRVINYNLTTETYVMKDFTFKKQEKICNYICLTKEKLCKS